MSMPQEMLQKLGMQQVLMASKDEAKYIKSKEYCDNKEDALQNALLNEFPLALISLNN